MYIWFALPEKIYQCSNSQPFHDLISLHTTTKPNHNYSNLDHLTPITDLAIIGDLILHRSDLVQSRGRFIQLIVVANEVGDVAKDVDELTAHVRASRFGVRVVAILKVKTFDVDII